MPADTLALPSPPHVFKVRDSYLISERQDLLKRYRSFFQRLEPAYGRKLSAQAVADVVDNVFHTFSHWTEVRDPLFRAVFNGARLDVHTMRNLMRCELGLHVRKLHVRSLRVLDAFLQIVEHDPPDWLTEILTE